MDTRKIIFSFLSCKWLLSPFAIYAGIILGFILGIFFKDFAALLTPYGSVFLSLLQMFVIPILITAVISSIGRLIQSGKTMRYIGRLLVIFVTGLFAVSLIGIVIGVIARPGADLSEESQVTLGKVILQSEIQSTGGQQDKSVKGIVGFIKSMVPSNFFRAVNRGDNLSILFFCILLGLALGFVRSRSGDITLTVIETFYDAFQKLIGWVRYIFPFGLCCLFASQIAQVGYHILSALGIFVVFFYIAAFIVILIYNDIIWVRTGRKGSFFSPFLALRDTLVIAFGTSNTYVAVPSSLRCLNRNLGVKKGTANFIMPLGVNLNPQGTALYFALASIFVAQIYNVHLGFEGYFMILVGAVLTAMITPEVPGAGSIGMIAFILGPLGIPTGAAAIFLFAVSPITDPILTVTEIQANCAAAVLADKRKKKVDKPETPMSQVPQLKV